MIPIKNSYYYEVQGTFKSSKGIDYVNPIFKIKTDTNQTTIDHPICFNEYNMYPSLDVYNNSKAKGEWFDYDFIVKFEDVEFPQEEGEPIIESVGKIVKNFNTNLGALGIDLQLSQSPEQQKIMIADFLDVDVNNITLVMEQ